MKGLGGYQLACDATNATAVSRLRTAKRRNSKPFALMARDLDVIRRYCNLSAEEAALLQSSSAPDRSCCARSGQPLPEAVAPGLRTFGFMLPTTPLHLLLLHDMDVPVVMTSGNLTDTPQIIDDDEALTLLGHVADFVLTHDRADSDAGRRFGGPCGFRQTQNVAARARLCTFLYPVARLSSPPHPTCWPRVAS